MNRTARSIATGMGGFGLMAAGLVVIDERVREQVMAVANGGNPSGELLSVSARLRELGVLAFQALRHQSIEHAPLTLFALAALILFVLMLRT